MPNPARSQPDLADIVALARALEREEQRPAGEVRDWERRIAGELPVGSEDRAVVALAWLEGCKDGDEAVRAAHQRAETAVHLTSIVIVVAGMLLGWGATLGAFYFDGSGRVNAVLVLALLVILPAVLLLPFVVAALPGGLTTRIPGAGVLAALARGMSAGRLALLAWRVFPRELRDALALVSGRMEKHRRQYATLQKWALLRWSQMFAVAFQAAVLLAAVVLVVFTDLAFGWSTTLTTGDAARDAQRVHGITSAIAAPWSWAWPQAQPSLPLIEESRYYRVAWETVSRAEAARLGGWWKFLVVAIAVYGLLPRLVTLAIAHVRLRAAARAAMIVAPGVSALVRRLHRAQVETAAIEPELGDAAVARTVEPRARQAAAGIRAVINWSGVPVEPGAFAASFPDAPVFPAGGAAAMQEDAELAKRLGELVGRDGGGDLAIVVKAWEPPLMEFIDFLKMLRDAARSNATTITVLPTGLDAARLGGATAAQLKLWRDKLASIGDPWLRVAADPAEAQA